MNKSDSERIAGMLNNLGFKNTTNPDSADLIIFNLCSVRQSAIDRATSKIKNFAKSKCQNPNVKSSSKSKILLTGCILNKNRRKLEEFCDGTFKIDEIRELPSILEKIGFKGLNKNETEIKHYLDIMPEYELSPTACVPIMTGCNNFCSYCVVPYTRGREVSRSVEDILYEVKNLVHPVRESKGIGCSKKSDFSNGVKQGVKEIWLLGQNVNSYGIKPKIKNTKAKTTTQKSKMINFADLLKMVNDIDGDFWVRFTSSHPKDLTDEMIDVFAKCQKITPYLNLPIQSGDNEVLKAMNRPYSVEDYKKLIKKVRSAFKKYRKGQESVVFLSTDAIVGFPGETRKQFQNTKKIFKEIGFSAGYISLYSPRHQSTAFKLKDNISPSEKHKRKKELVKILEKSALDFNKKFLNKEVKCLILEKRDDMYIGKTKHYQTIRIRSNKDILGQFVKVKIDKIEAFRLFAKT